MRWGIRKVGTGFANVSTLEEMAVTEIYVRLELRQAEADKALLQELETIFRIILRWKISQKSLL